MINATPTLLPGVTIRPIKPDDAERLQAFHAHLSPQTIRLRFHGLLKELPIGMARRFCEVDGYDRVAYVATTGNPERIVGVGRYDWIGDDEAEIAFVVADDYQRHDIGKMLLQRVLDAARKRGLRRLVAHVLSGNTPMVHLIEHSGYPFRIQWAGDHNNVWVTVPA